MLSYLNFAFRRLAQQFPSAALSISLAVLPASAVAQSSSSSSSSPNSATIQTPKAPAVIQPGGPSIGLETSESLFQVAAALNACGYDAELQNSDPVRLQVREAMNQALAASAAARDARDRMCAFVVQHKLTEPGRDLAQYISLALYLTPPPALAPSVQEVEMPPDSTQVLAILPMLREFSEAVNLHGIWVLHRASYEEAVSKLHDPLTRMIVATDIYLKQPVSSYEDRRFLVLLEPMLAPGETNARIYGGDYIVVTSPVGGTIHMDQVRHTYLHYELEPLLYARAQAMDRLLPLLKTIREAPLDFSYRSDIVALVTESMIKGIEARTMDTGIAVYKAPVNALRSDAEKIYREQTANQQEIEAVRRKAVQTAMEQGFVLTQYFYESMIRFEKDPGSLKESIGEMVYGMDVDSERKRAERVEFARVGSQDVVRRGPRQFRGLDLAELDLMKGNSAEAEKLANQALVEKGGDAARANFILARVYSMQGEMDQAVESFHKTIAGSKDPRTLAWSHIYLGRIYDLQDERDNAVAEYKAALTVRDSQTDTKQAAEKGLKTPFAKPQRAQNATPDASAKPE